MTARAVYYASILISTCETFKMSKGKPHTKYAWWNKYWVFLKPGKVRAYVIDYLGV